MSKKKDERTVEHTRACGAEPGVSPASSALIAKSQRTHTKTAEGIDQKAKSGDRRNRAKRENAPGSSQRQKATQSTTKKKAPARRKHVKPEMISEENLSADKTLKVDDEIVLEQPSEFHRQQPTPDVAAPAMKENVQPGSIVVQDPCCEEEPVPPHHDCEKDEGITPQLLESAEELVQSRESANVLWATIMRWLAVAWSSARKRLGSRQAKKRLRVCESVSLGEKRFVAVIEVDGEQFLVGGASGSVVTLARLEPTNEFSEVLRRRWAQDPVPA